MVVRIQEINNIVLLKLDGEFTLDFSPIFIEIIQSLLDKKKSKILISLEKVTKIDSTGLGTLIAMTGTLEYNGASLKILHLSVQAKRVFNFNNLQDYIEIYSDRSLAIAAFSKRSL